MNPWTPAFILTGLIAFAALVSIWRERRAHDKELLDKRTRHYQGGDLT
jgi:hypothetical protein